MFHAARGSPSKGMGLPSITRDQWHQEALKWEKIVSEADCQLLTTEYILIEIANGLSALRFRSQAVRIIDALMESTRVTILPAQSELFEAGFELYRSRNDKSWGLTDCMSFMAMEQQSIQASLTTDEHFIQAGFCALLLED